MEQTPYDDTDLTLEKTVLLALSRLQKRKTKSKKQPASAGVSCKNVVQFLLTNYPWVDGDVESQVMTALLSCIKTGIVCALNSRKFLLIGANTKNMPSNCVTRVSHGSKCGCISMLKVLVKNYNNCCVIKNSGTDVKKLKKAVKGKLGGGKPKAPPSSKQKEKKIPKKPVKGCAQNAQDMIGTSKSALSLCGKNATKCNYCMEIHSLPKLRNLCMTCYPVGKIFGVPSNKFSPRDEVSPVANIP